ncbi:MAG: hypothetical protein H6888_10360 [Nitratireductor sp.]|nr:hypothetical protein [Nitratireductor sp.]
MKTSNKKSINPAGMAVTLGATLLLAVTSVVASAQQSYNVGPRNVGPKNIGPGYGGGGYLPDRVTFYLDGDTRVRIRGGSYTASVDGIRCSGGVRTGDETYRLFRGGCSNGRDAFHGGTLECYRFPRCRWEPSASGRRLGFRSETVFVN